MHQGFTSAAPRPQPQADAEAHANMQGMADCMDMVRQELIEAGIIDASVAPMFIANAVLGYIQKRLADHQGEGLTSLPK